MQDESARERIVRLETQVEPILTRLDSIDAKVGKISDWMTDKKGFISGVIFCFMLVGTAFGAVSMHLWKYFVSHE